MDFFLADEDKLFATAYGPLSWNEGFIIRLFTWTMRSHDLLIRGMWKMTQKSCVLLQALDILYGAHKYKGKVYDL